MKNCYYKLLLMLIIIIVFSACASEKVIEQTATPFPSESEVIEVIEKINKLVITVPFTGNENKSTENYVKAWEMYFLENFNINIDLNVISDGRYNSYVSYDDNIQNSKSLLLTYPAINIFELSDNNLIYDLNEFLKDNETWNKYPEYFRNSMKFNGSIKAIPAAYYYKPRYNIRFFNSSLFSMDIPTMTTIDEFYEICLSRDSDDILSVSGEELLAYADIYNSFGILNGNTQFNIFWDDKNKEFSDNMFNKSQVKCLLWLNNAYLNKIIDPRNNEDLFLGSVYRPEDYIAGTSQKASQFDKYICFIDNPNYVSKKPAFNYNEGGFIVPKSIPYEEANYMVNAFVDLFYGNEEAFYSGQYGIIGEQTNEYSNFTMNDGKINVFINEKNEWRFFINVLSKYSEYATSEYYKNISFFGDDEEYITYWNNKYSDNKRYYNEINLDLEEYFCVSRSNYSRVVSNENIEKGKLLSEMANQLSIQAIVGEINPDEALSEYFEYYKKVGAQENYFDIVNAFFKD